MKKLNGKRALVIGGSRGIGLAVVKKLAEDGAAVMATYAGGKEETERLVAGLESGQNKHSAERVDLNDPETITSLFAKAVQTGGVDIVVIAGSAPILDKPLAKVSDEEFMRIMRFNVLGLFQTLREAANKLNDSGRIVVFSTPYTLQPQARRGVTGASKAASDLLALTLAKELGPRQITVNSIMPGPTETESFAEQVPEALHDQLRQMTPLGRLGRPQDVADVVSFLCSDDARWITGQTIRVTGGLL